MVTTRAGKETVPQHSDSEAEGMDSPLNQSGGQNQNQTDDIDPAMYNLFKRMMTRMMSEQAEASQKEVAPKSKPKKKAVKKPVKIVRKKVQPDTTSEETESVEEESEEEEQFAYHQNPLPQLVKIAAEPESINKPIPANDPMQEQMKEMNRASRISRPKARASRPTLVKIFTMAWTGMTIWKISLASSLNLTEQATLRLIWPLSMLNAAVSGKTTGHYSFAFLAA